MTEACMGLDPLLVIGVFTIGMAVGALLMKIRIMDAVATAVSEKLEEANSPAIRGHQSVSA